MSQLSADAKDFARMLSHAADCIEFTEKVRSYNDCNNCGGSVKPYCPYLPEWGDMVRINCPLWYEKK